MRRSLSLSLLLALCSITFQNQAAQATGLPGCSYDNQGQVAETTDTSNLGTQYCYVRACNGWDGDVAFLAGSQSISQYMCICDNGSCWWHHGCTTTITYEPCETEEIACPPCRAEETQIRASAGNSTTHTGPSCGADDNDAAQVIVDEYQLDQQIMSEIISDAGEGSANSTSVGVNGAGGAKIDPQDYNCLR